MTGEKGVETQELPSLREALSQWENIVNGWSKMENRTVLGQRRLEGLHTLLYHLPKLLREGLLDEIHLDPVQMEYVFEVFMGAVAVDSNEVPGGSMYKINSSQMLLIATYLNSLGR